MIDFALYSANVPASPIDIIRESIADPRVESLMRLIWVRGGERAIERHESVSRGVRRRTPWELVATEMVSTAAGQSFAAALAIADDNDAHDIDLTPEERARAVSMVNHMHLLADYLKNLEPRIRNVLLMRAESGRPECAITLLEDYEAAIDRCLVSSITPHATAAD